MQIGHLAVGRFVPTISVCGSLARCLVAGSGLNCNPRADQIHLIPKYASDAAHSEMSAIRKNAAAVAESAIPVPTAT